MQKINLYLLFGIVWVASGARGTFDKAGEYRHHWPHWLWRLLYFGTAFVAKTVTSFENDGNTEVKKDGFSVKDFWPKSVWMTLHSWWKKFCLNCYGLSNAGIDAAIATGEWQKKDEPFMISWMPITDDPAKEVHHFAEAVRSADFRTRIVIQYNGSCPNVGCNLEKVAAGIRSNLDKFQEYGLQALVKVHPGFPIELALELQSHPACLGFIVSNAIPFGEKMPEGFPQIPWEKLFGTSNPKESPLSIRFAPKEKTAGGLSGKPLLPLVCHWIREARKAGLACHINGGGGITGPWSAWKVFRAGADSISLGTISMFRPWMIPVTTIFAKLFCKPHRK